ncbi:acetyl/propionyl/methylcrotonyl-CoA carboxylase subunit alpha [Pusillimonas sp. ANT_WB101]|uniref:acetyl-CoA carboxylase biotin carboxylase subunit n=1 Tax=Pusillimonas sp. ANT_WB101 TaxID=2597356 RepID=UPI0011EC7DE9|nr:biotin carboxylase N-terminal domain-containing protein [Pusillimonas sp. ANT_WB101]KAA0910426.1 biotin carboxylase [Pusillimonas sp. ANT_WB101]
MRLSVKKISRVLVANRGAIARRIIRASRALGLESVVIYSEADKDLSYLQEADFSECIGPAAPVTSYLNSEIILDVARRYKVDALHPGYGFLSENGDFAQAVQDAGICFIGPAPRLIRMLGHKTKARDAMRKAGMPMVESSDVLSGDIHEVRAVAEALGFPLLIKPAAGGGGIGMLPLYNTGQIDTEWERARAIAERSFGRTDLYLEQLLRAPRHIEFQFLADKYGGVRCIFERDCSTQRRHQKVLEEAPAPLLDRAVVSKMGKQLEEILAALAYDVIGTVEMLYTPERGFSFLEMNTRLQVEHAVTEEVTGIDMVTSQIRLAAGESIAEVLPNRITLEGHAIEARVYAEDPLRFIPSPGILKEFRPPVMQGIRIETGYEEGARISSYYDPLVAKVIAKAPDRIAAIDKLSTALDAFSILGVKTNIPFIQRVLKDADFRRGVVSTEIVHRILA